MPKATPLRDYTRDFTLASASRIGGEDENTEQDTAE